MNEDNALAIHCPHWVTTLAIDGCGAETFWLASGDGVNVGSTGKGGKGS